MYITRDKENGDLTLWFKRPRRSYTFWKSDEDELGILLEGEDFKAFDYVTWEDEPIEINILSNELLNEIIDCLRLSYNSFNGITGIDIDKKVVKESSLSKRIRKILEYVGSKR